MFLLAGAGVAAAQDPQCSVNAVEHSIVGQHRSPDLEGCRVADVADGLRRAEVKVSQQSVRVEGVAGTIVSQQPAAGTILVPGMSLEVGVADGLGPVPVKQKIPPAGQIFVQNANLEVAVEPSEAPTVRAGKTVEFRVTVANLGPSEARGIQLRLVKTENMAFERATGACLKVPCTLARLAPGALADTTVVARVSTEGEYSAAFTASALTHDPDRANNNARLRGMARSSVDWAEIAFGGALLVLVGAGIAIYPRGRPAPDIPVVQVLVEELVPGSAASSPIEVSLRVYVLADPVPESSLGVLPIRRTQLIPGQEVEA